MAVGLNSAALFDRKQGKSCNWHLDGRQRHVGGRRKAEFCCCFPRHAEEPGLTSYILHGTVLGRPWMSWKK